MDPIPDKVGFESVEVKRKKQGLVIQRDYVRILIDMMHLNVGSRYFMKLFVVAP